MISERASEFATIFYPKSVAVIGASGNPAKFGGLYLKTLLDFGFAGDVYPVNPQESEVGGLKAYPTVLDIPAPVDFGIITVPAAAVPDALQHCLAKGMKAAEIFSAGFSEVGEQGRILEEKLARIARKGIRVIGPNCFGVYCPASRITLLPGADFSTETGPVALISQSGGHAQEVAREAKAWGIRFSKVVSYGNACDLNEADFLEYLADDPDTKVIAAYIEGPRDGTRFMEQAKRATPTKPVLVWKAGLTHEGAKAVSSHTGSLGGEEATWRAFFKQTGATRVAGKDELIDAIQAFLYLPASTGPRVAVVGGGGGMSVAAADACARVGLSIPEFPPEVTEKLRMTLPPAGNSIRNPIDVGAPVVRPQVFHGVLEAAASAPNVDIVIATQTLHLFMGARMKDIAKAVATIVEASLRVPVSVAEQYGKPLVMVLPEGSAEVDSLDVEKARREFRDFYVAHDIPVYPTLERAATAVAHVVHYYQGRTNPGSASHTEQTASDAAQVQPRRRHAG